LGNTTPYTYLANLTQLSYRNFQPQGKHQQGNAYGSNRFNKFQVTNQAKSMRPNGYADY
jgi:hypothetical protein